MASSGLAGDCMESDRTNTKSNSVSLLETYLKCAGCEARDVCGIFPTCLHFVCGRCSENLKTDDRYYCPTCNECSEKIIGNPNLTISDNTHKSPTCNWCEDNGEHTKSIGHCADCDIWLCAECLKGHNRMPPLRNHNITKLEKNGNQGTLRCQSHPDETLECFCESCGVLTCRDCQLSVHRDHGSHRWVGEKAVLMKAPLDDAALQLQQFQHKLVLAYDYAHKARIDTNEDSLVSSIEKSRRDIKSRSDALVNAIRMRSQYLLSELDKKGKQSISQLQDTEGLIKKLQEQIMLAVTFAKHLIQVTESDPASLVQLFDTVKTRLDLLQVRAESIVEDNFTVSETNSDCYKSVIGWRKSANTRSVFLGNWNSDDLIPFSGTVAWLPKPRNGQIHLSSDKPINGSHSLNELVKTSELQVLKPPICPLSDETNDFLDSLAHIDSSNWVTVNSFIDSSQPNVGCEVCFGVGLLALCNQCHRAYHMECHIPRLSNTSLNSGWLCGLCINSDPIMIPSNGTRMSYDEYSAGCRILLNLLVHPEAVHFTASVCPACSAPLFGSANSVSHCSEGHLYHQLADLRHKLEQAVSSVGEDYDAKCSKSVTLAKTVESHLGISEWLAEVEKFWSDVSKETGIKGATKGCVRAAQQIRSHFVSLVREQFPNYEFSTNDLTGKKDFTNGDAQTPFTNNSIMDDDDEEDEEDDEVCDNFLPSMEMISTAVSSLLETNE